ncbi:O-acyltransferase like protein-like isoform X2 [Cylas formicarius]|uniref:O-acyltransferase like protein-like isoform X2 n=1 Tax=Cylas formicarius TaxID=197179 RepID=UPI00295832A9|nr:O-acyltransferase like protein-like isoform X2 [Cylas formicarius]
MKYLFIVAVIVIFGISKSVQVTDQQYASMPDLFYLDNFDKCMLYGDRALFCSFRYTLEPIDGQNVSEVWKIIQNVTSHIANYQHNQLRHQICVTTTCHDVRKAHENDPTLKRELEDCYNKKYTELGLKGTIKELSCETANSRYSVDWLDIISGIFFILYASFILYATFYESVARYKSPEEYRRLTSTPKGVILSSCSLVRSWIKLKTVNWTPEVEKLRCIQGLRFYNIGLVVLSHTVLTYLAVPTSNTKYPENMHQSNGVLFFSSGPLCVGTFFFISSFLLSQSLFEYLSDKKGINMKMYIFAMANRFFRLVPTVFFVVLFHATWLRHFGAGPFWHDFIGEEFRKCRKNGWSNVLFLNNFVDKYNMCLPTTWYLALDTQFFAFGILYIGFIKKYEKYVWPILGTTMLLNMTATFLQNLYYDFPALIFPTAELQYKLEGLTHNFQFYTQIAGHIGNFGGYLNGIGFGYYYQKNKNKKIFNTKFRVFVWWMSTFVLALSYIFITSLIFFRWSVERSPRWASLYVAVSRPLFTFVIGIGLLGFTEGLALRVLQWSPLYVLGRLNFSVYLIHLSFALIRLAYWRYPVYVSDYVMRYFEERSQITKRICFIPDVSTFLLHLQGLLEMVGIVTATTFFSDMVVSYIGGAVLTLCIEMPVAELQKRFFSLPEKEKPETESKEQ